MKKSTKVIFGCVLIVIAIVGAVGICLWSDEANLQNISTMTELFNKKYSSYRMVSNADYMQYTYDELLARAHTIALVTPLDELTPENSYGITDSGDRFYNAHSLRQIKVLSFYKNEKNLSDQFTVVESCAMLDDGAVVGMDSWYPMQKNETYLVFLKDSGLGYPMVLSADNGKFDLTNLRLNAPNRQPLIAEALLDFALYEGNNMTRSSSDALTLFAEAEYLSDSVHYPEEYDVIYQSHEWSVLYISSSYTLDGMILELEYSPTEDGYLYHLNNRIMQATR